MAVGSQLNGYLAEIADALFTDAFGNLEDNAVLSDIAKITMGQSPAGTSYNEEGVGTVFYQGRGEFGWRYPAQRLFTTEPKRMAKSGDVLMSVRAPVGDLNLAYEDCCIGRGLAAISCDYPSYCLYLMRSLGKKLDAYNGEGTVFGSISGKALKGIGIGLPGNDDIAAFEAMVAPIDAQIRCNETESRILSQLRDALLPKLMSGEIGASKVHLARPNSHLLHYVQRAVHTVAIVLDERNSVETVINTVLSEMQGLLDPHQLKHLAITLRQTLGAKQTEPEQDLLALFLTAKEVEGCSPKTIAYYEATLRHMNAALAKPYTQVESDDLRRYLNDYEVNRGSSKVTIDNIRRIMSSFFSWLEDEDYIVKSPVRRIRRVKTVQVTKEVLSDEELEVLRDACESKRDLAIVDLLASTGMRIGELVRLDRKDVDLHERECLVMGKGNKQRPVYFDARAKLHLTEYLASRADNSPALFVALDSSARRITVGSIELRLRGLGRRAGINRVHPHKFRRTLATHAIDRGMPIEQVQKLLGHAKIDTTMHYAMVNQNNVKASHRKYLE